MMTMMMMMIMMMIMMIMMVMMMMICIPFISYDWFLEYAPGSRFHYFHSRTHKIIANQAQEKYFVSTIIIQRSFLTGTTPLDIFVYG